ncbi:MAG: sulfotransferase family protein [Planctomycetota bacterium]
MKVFGIGFQRTGTTSLGKALNALGIRTLDCPKQLWYDLDDPVIQEFDGFTDNPVPLLYRDLDARHPGAKFVQTIRAEEAWLSSVEWLFTVGAEKFNWRTKEHFNEFHRALYGRTDFDPDVFLAAYRRHNAAVVDYFRDRPGDLLVMDVTQGDSFDKLCPFLGVPVPADDFPTWNRRESRLKVRLRRWWGRLRR